VTTIKDEIIQYPMVTERGVEVDPIYRELQSRGPVKVRLPHGEPCWLATRYDDVRTVYGDRRFGRAAGLDHDMPGMFPGELVKNPALLLNMDPPEHTRLRRLTSGAFSPARVAAMEARVQGLVDGLLDDMSAQGRCADFVPSFAEQLPVKVLVGILGVAEEDSKRFVGLVTNLSDHDLDGARREAAREALYGYIGERIAERRERPTDDLLSALVEARDEGDRLTEDELFSLCIALWGGGFKTTLMQLGTTVFTLMTHRHLWQELLDDPEILPAGLEELWRWIPSFRYGFPFPRWASENVELSGGVVVQAGEPVLPEHAVANRDESVFPNGWELDFHRVDPRPHLSLAFGPHYCMGAHVALLQVRVAVESLLRRFPTLQLAVPESEVPWSTKSLMRAVAALPVKW
jgi:cytochrome P450